MPLPRNNAIGFRIDGKTNWCFGDAFATHEKLVQLLAFFCSADPARLRERIRALQPVDPESAVTPQQRQALHEYGLDQILPDDAGLRCWCLNTVSQQAYLEAWYEGLPYLPALRILSSEEKRVFGWLWNADDDRFEIYLEWANRQAACTDPDSHPCCPAPDGMQLAAVIGFDDLQRLQPTQLEAVLDAIDTMRDPSQDIEYDVRLAHERMGHLPTRESGWVPAKKGIVMRFRAAGADITAQARIGDTVMRLVRLDTMTLGDEPAQQALTSVLDPDLLDLARAVYGNAPKLWQFFHAVNHQDSIDLLREDGAPPNMLPLLRLALERKFDPAQSGSPRRLPSAPVAADYLGQLHASLLDMGWTRATWQFLSRQSAQTNAALVEYIIRPADPGLINQIARIMQGEPLVPGLIENRQQFPHRFIASAEPPGGGSSPEERALRRIRHQNFCAAFREMMREGARTGCIDQIIEQRLDVADYLRQETRLLPRFTWRSLARRAKDWHEACFQAEIAHDHRQWGVPGPLLRDGDYAAQELITAKALAEEGRAMQHCVRKYVERCMAGASRIFSIQRQGQRLATLEIVLQENGAWTVGQLRGKRNAAIADHAVQRLGAAIANGYRTHRISVRRDGMETLR